MKKNVGSVDRAIRIASGTAIIVWGLTANNWLGAIGLLPLLTGIFQFCPAYCPFGLSTGGDCCSKDGCGSCTKE